MTGQVVLSKNLSAVRPAVVVWVTAGVAVLVLVYLIAGRIESTVTRWPPTIHEAVAPMHCNQFIALAKAAYGDNWRVRLDPRDTTCAIEVRDEWERQHLPRDQALPAFVTTPTVTAAPPVEPVAAPAPATYCLNVISLAKAKYGEVWRSKLTPEEAQSCAPEAAPPAQ
jgi:hypothetical protein